MTTAQAVGAVSGEAKEWYAIDWQTIHRNVRRLQVRIAQATQGISTSTPCDVSTFRNRMAKQNARSASPQ